MGFLRKFLGQDARPSWPPPGPLTVWPVGEQRAETRQYGLAAAWLPRARGLQQLRALSTAAAHDGTIDLVLTDVVLPGESGPELAQMLAKQRPNLRILFASGYTGEMISTHGVVAGAPYLQKPFSLTVLAGKVRETLDASVPNLDVPTAT